jgi:hypothetical protein
MRRPLCRAAGPVAREAAGRVSVVDLGEPIREIEISPADEPVPQEEPAPQDDPVPERVEQDRGAVAARA